MSVTVVEERPRVSVRDNGAVVTAVGIQGPQGDPGMAWRGAWDVAHAYDPGDAVSEAGSSYIAVVGSTGIDPGTDDGTHWQALAHKGDPGTTLFSGLADVPAGNGFLRRDAGALDWDANTYALEADLASYALEADLTAEAAARAAGDAVEAAARIAGDNNGVTLAPGTGARNVVQATGDVTALTVKAILNQTADLQQWSTAAAVVAGITSDGFYYDGVKGLLTSPAYGRAHIFGRGGSFTFAGSGAPADIWAPLVIYPKFGDDSHFTNAPIYHTTQAVIIAAAYYGPAVDDSMEGLSAYAIAEDTGTPYTQAHSITGIEGGAQIGGGNHSTGGMIGTAGRLRVLNTAIADAAAGVYSTYDKDVGATITNYYAFQQAKAGAGVNNYGLLAYDEVHVEATGTKPGFSLGKSGNGGQMGLYWGGSGSEVSFMRLVIPDGTNMRTLTIRKIAGQTQHPLGIIDDTGSENFFVSSTGTVFSIAGLQVTNTAGTQRFVADNNGNVQILNPVAANVPLLVKAAASQSGNLTEWRDSSANLLSAFGPGGRLGVGTTPLGGAAISVVPFLNSQVGLYIQGAIGQATDLFYAADSDANALFRIMLDGTLGLRGSSPTGNKNAAVDTSTYTDPPQGSTPISIGPALVLGVNTANSFRGLALQPTLSGAFNNNDLTGLLASPSTSQPAGVTQPLLQGIQGAPQVNTGAGVNLTNLRGLIFNPAHRGVGVVSTVAALFLQNEHRASGTLNDGTITTSQGLYYRLFMSTTGANNAGTQGQATNNYGFYIDAPAISGTNPILVQSMFGGRIFNQGTSKINEVYGLVIEAQANAVTTNVGLVAGGARPSGVNYGALIYQQVASGVGLVVKMAAAPSNDLMQWQDSGGGLLWSLNKNGHLVGGSKVLYVPTLGSTFGSTTSIASVVLSVKTANDANVGIAIQANSGTQTADLQRWTSNVPATLSRVDKNGTIITARNAAPADADLNNGEVAIWLDPTPAATKVMFKAKDSGGTVRTAALAMA